MSKPAPSKSKSLGTLSGFRTTEAKTRALFSRIDNDFDGTLSRREIEAYIKSVLTGASSNLDDRAFLLEFGITAHSFNDGLLNDLFEEMDVDHDGKVTLPEFTAAMLLHKERVINRAHELQRDREFRARFLASVAVVSVATAVLVALWHRRK